MHIYIYVFIHIGRCICIYIHIGSMGSGPGDTTVLAVALGHSVAWLTRFVTRAMHLPACTTAGSGPRKFGLCSGMSSEIRCHILQLQPLLRSHFRTATLLRCSMNTLRDAEDRGPVEGEEPKHFENCGAESEAGCR